MNKIQIYLFILIIYLGCTSSNSSTSSDDSELNLNTITTSNIYENNFYFDIINGIETDSNSIWQISFQKKTINYECTQDDVETELLCSEVGQTLQFFMPSAVLGDVLAAVYDLDYDNLDTYPDTFNEDAQLFDNSSIEYGGENVIINYLGNNQFNLSELVLIIYYMGNHKVYKIKFNEYSSGIINFDFQQL